MSFFKTYQMHLLVFLLLIIVSIASGSIAYRTGPAEQSPVRVEQMSEPKHIVQTNVNNFAKPMQGVGQIETKSRILQTDTQLSSGMNLTPASNQFETPAVLEHPISIHLIVDGQTLDITVESGSTIHDVMLEAKKQFRTFTFTTKNYKELGQFIESINGVANDPDTPLYWTLYINDQRSALGVSNYTVKDGDTILWKFENINNT